MDRELLRPRPVVRADEHFFDWRSSYGLTPDRLNWWWFHLWNMHRNQKWN